MTDTPETVAMRETLRFVVGSDLPAQHKRILIESMTQALRLQQDVETRGAALKAPSQEWQPHETKIVAEYLDQKVAGSWQHADEIALRLAAQLHRSLEDVRSKAVELGFGRGVDYLIAKRASATHVQE